MDTKTPIVDIFDLNDDYISSLNKNILSSVHSSPLISTASEPPLKPEEIADLPWDKPPMVMFGDDLTSASQFWFSSFFPEKNVLRNRMIELATEISGKPLIINRGWIVVFPKKFGREPHNHIKFGVEPDLVCTYYISGTGTLRIHQDEQNYHEIETKPGMMIFMDGSTIHSVPKNTSSEPRLVLVTNLVRN